MPYRDWIHPLRIFGKFRFAATKIFPYTKPTIVMTGTGGLGCLESEVVAGGQTIILTISQGKWAKAGAVFNAVRQAIINGLDSAQAEAAGWDAEVKAKEVVGAVVRTSATVVTITLSAAAAYSTTASETITMIVPAAAMEGQFEPITAGTFVVTTGS